MLKNYMVRASGSAGIASRSWLSINWPMNKFNNNREYSYVDEVFHHENAHTQGYSHNSGLAYGWDCYVNNGYVTPGVIAKVQSKIYAHYNSKHQSLILFSKSTVHVNSIKVIGEMDALKYSWVVDNQYLIEKWRKSTSPSIFNVNYDNDRTFTYIASYLLYEDKLAERDPCYLNLNKKSQFIHDTKGDIIYYIPEQSGVLAHDTAV